MATNDNPPVWLLLGSMIAPEDIPEPARLGEELGYEEVWMAEDYFFTAGISSAVAALAATRRLSVGTGIVSALVRHPALLAMEVATIARIYPGRFRLGIGLGSPIMIRRMGLYPKSSLNAVRDCVITVRRLLAGEGLTREGPDFKFDTVTL